MPGVALLFPTGTDPRSPYLALPCLAAALRRAGIDVCLHDLDVGGLHAILTSSSLGEAGRIVRGFGRSELESNALLQRLAEMADELAERAVPALDALRDPARFYKMIPGLTLARRLKERGYFVVLGGTLLAKFTDRLRTLPAFFEAFADGVVPYEGETALTELVGSLRTSRDFSAVPNFLFRSENRICSGLTHIEDVETLSCPDFDGLPLDRYLTPSPVLPTYLGKGCYFNRCKFCDIPYINHISKKPYRMRSVERVVSDLVTLKRKHGCRHFELTDEALPPRTLEHLAEALEPHKSEEFRFVGYARLEPAFTSDVCARLAGMGMRKLFFGLESGCQETLDHMDKGIRLSDVPAILSNCSAAGIRYHLFTIIGFPEETEERARETFEFFRKHAGLIDHPGNSFDIHPFGLELRTAYFHEAGQNGALIHPEAMRHEFVIGVGSEWTNSRGISRSRTEELLNEFYVELHNIFPRYHAAPQHLWPAFEEFAVLYADFYSDADFAFRTSVPDESDERPYCFRWNPATHREPFKDEFMAIVGRYGDVLMDMRTYRQIESAGPQTVRETVSRLAESVPHVRGAEARQFVRETIDSLVQRGLLQIHPGVSSGASVRVAVP